MEGPKIRQDKLWCLSASSVQQMSPGGSWRQSMSWLLSLRALFGVRCTCTSFQRCFLKLCSGSSLFSCFNSSAICLIKTIDGCIQMIVRDCSIARLVSFVSDCLYLQLVRFFSVRTGRYFYLQMKMVTAVWGSLSADSDTSLNGGRKIQVSCDVTTGRGIIISRRFGGSHAFLAEQFNLEQLDPEGVFINL
jgi:hypothetical protein